MSNYVLFTDTDCDISLHEAKTMGMELISMPYTIDEKEIYPYVDYEEFDSKSFYDKLRKGVLPTTAGLSPARYVEIFEPFFAKGLDILYVHFSSAMSGTFASVEVAYKELKEKYPGRRLERVDTKGIASLSYAIVKQVHALKEEGKSIDEILAWAKEEVDHYAVYFYADDLKFFGKSGRVSGISAFMGNIIGIRPLIHVNAEGKMVSCDKAIGRANAVKKLLDLVESLQDDITKYPVYISHTDCLFLAHRAGAELKKKYGHALKLEYIPVNPTIGSHCGPDCVGVAFHSKGR